MTNSRKNIIGGVGLAVLLVAGTAYAAWSYWPKRVHHHPALQVDVSNYDADQIIAFVRGLGDLNAIPDEDRVALFNKLKTRFDVLPGPEKAKLLMTAMQAYQDNKLDPVAVNGRELMKAYQHVMLTDYFKSDAAGRKKVLDQKIDEQQAMESVRNLAGMFGKKSDDPNERLNMMRSQIGDAIQDSLRNGTPEDRAMMTQFMMEMRQERLARGLKVLF